MDGAGDAIWSTRRRLNERLSEYYTAYNIRDRLELSMKVLSAESLVTFPMLSGPGVKGATVRALVPFVAEVAAELQDGSRRQHRRHLMMTGLMDWYRLTDSSVTFLSVADQAEVREAVHRFLLNYQYVANWCLSGPLEGVGHETP